MYVGTILAQSLYTVWAQIFDFLPEFLLALVILLVGAIVAFFLKQGVVWVFEQLRLNTAGEWLGLKQVVERGGAYHLPGFLGWLVKWFILAFTFLAALEVAGLTGVAAFIASLFGYLSHAVVAALMLLVGVVAANFMSGLVRGGIRAARLASAQFLANAAWLAIFVFSLVAALNELQVSAEVVRYGIIGTVALLALAGGIAFGTGRPSAKSWFEKMRRDIVE